MWSTRTRNWFLAPTVLTLLVIGIFPLLFALNISLRQYQITNPGLGFGWNNFANYVTVLSDSYFWGSLGRTFFFLALTLPVQFILGLLIALILHRQEWPFLRAVARVALVIPLATTPAVVGLIGRLMFDSDFGLANWIVTLFGAGKISFLGDPNLALFSLAVMDTWQWTPFFALVLLASLTAVPQDAVEAATLETTRRWDLFRYVEWPYLLPGLTAVLILRTADTMKLFDLIFVMTRGGPGTATELISVYTQRIGFRVFDQGVAAAMAILSLIVTIILARWYIRIFYREAE
ncbi:carbohydrate ABC transporter permease [Meiothermus granaticius]|uniref:Trehalose transport system permease protein SugA n=1 Tax=Meiothermus granaticius NBRC 107808 TaxID=1227551 RepID=A0A399FA34_9DEIN|nr:sugar ABC transporter permease [Meiothermus granaticius]MCL6527977.1 sugar ABC transporter permease [Thermaceae bacterium]RIH91491.1 Trehalose transport system permease protein SugA [Meiothermus granaticius NBRC 107808]GEM88273.1 binding-protein-dependent transport system inner membrane protein [Meiothermus granaticius NBRC 107808]